MLKGMTVMITGAAGGIGSIAAAMLAEAGANLVLTDRGEAGAQVAEALTARGLAAVYVEADVTAEDDVRRVVATAISTFGSLDGAFNNAGVEQHSKPVYELELDEFQRLMNVNITGVFLCMKHQIAAMRRGGSIVNTSSALGTVAIPAAAEYIASKHAVIGLTRGAAVDAAPLGIRVNAVCPGIVATAMIKRLTEDPVQAGIFEQLRHRHVLDRFAEPAEIVNAVKWLLSDQSSFVTGAAISVDGGYTTY